VTEYKLLCCVFKYFSNIFLLHTQEHTSSIKTAEFKNNAWSNIGSCC